MDPEGHGELRFTDVRVPQANLIAGPGAGFLIAQARLGPGRIHHCMRAVGAAERALELMCKRADERETFGKPVSTRSNIRDWIAEARIELEMLRLLVLKTAWLVDKVGGKNARIEVAAIKVAAPNVALKIIDRAIQVHGGARRLRRLPARVHVRAHAHAAARRRAGRGAQAASIARRELRRQRGEARAADVERAPDDDACRSAQEDAFDVGAVDAWLRRRGVADLGGRADRPRCASSPAAPRT